MEKESERDQIKRIFLIESEEERRWIWFELESDGIRFLDQRFLPAREEWVKCHDEEEVASAIKLMVVRGAPAIGIAAAFGVLYGVKNRVARGENVAYDTFQMIKRRLLDTRPTAYNLKDALEKMESVFNHSSRDELVEVLENTAKRIWFDDYVSCYLIGKFGSTLIPDNSYVFTICNTGALATGGWGTAFSAIRTAKREGKSFLVFSLETRPYLQGSRLTSWELLREKIDFRIIVDSSAPFVMSKFKNVCVLTGADRILKDGTTSNKIGTLMLAICSRYFSIPLYICAPRTTIDVVSDRIPIEQRDDKEVKEIFGVRVAPQDASAVNYSFDITPPELISAIVTDEGIFRYPYRFV